MRTEHIIKAVCDVTGIKLSDLLSKSRKEEIADAKKIAQWMAYYCRAEASTTDLKTLWGVDHTSILHNISAFEDLFSYNEKFIKACLLVLNRLGLAEHYDKYTTVSIKRDIIFVYTTGKVEQFDAEQLKNRIAPVYVFKKLKNNLASQKRQRHIKRYVPRKKPINPLIDARVNQLLYLYSSGVTLPLTELYKMFGITEYVVKCRNSKAVIAAARLERRKAKDNRLKEIDRNLRVYEMWEWTNMSVYQIGQALNISSYTRFS